MERLGPIMTQATVDLDRLGPPPHLLTIQQVMEGVAQQLNFREMADCLADGKDESNEDMTMRKNECISSLVLYMLTGIAQRGLMAQWIHKHLTWFTMYKREENSKRMI